MKSSTILPKPPKMAEPPGHMIMKSKFHPPSVTKLPRINSSVQSSFTHNHTNDSRSIAAVTSSRWNHSDDHSGTSAFSPTTTAGNVSYSLYDDQYPDDEEIDQYFEPYTSLGATMTAVPVAIIIFIIVSGNALVIAAVLRDPRLKRQVQNWLIVSLSAADLLVGLLIMPLTLTYEILDQWVLGDVLCELWLALDVLFVTASILNLCAISLDRYWSLTQPTVYPHKRTSKRMLIMIITVWLSAFAISFPPLVGWRPANRAASACYLSDQLGYVLYSALGSFFIPSLVLLFVYARIFCISRRRSKTKPCLSRGSVGVNTPLKTTVITPLQEQKQTVRNKKSRQSIWSNDTGEASKKVSLNAEPTYKVSTNDDVSRRLSVNGQTSGKTSVVESPSRKTSLNVPTAKPSISPDLAFNENDYAVLIAKVRHLAVARRQSTASDTGTLDSTGSSPDHIANRALSLVATIASEAVARSRQSESCTSITATCLKKQLMQRQKLVRRRERQATLVLGLVLGAFIGCWMPFFCSYVLSAVGLRTQPLLFDIVFWLGYCNSGLNAFIYNFFNPDFRRAFKRILHRPIAKIRMAMGADTLISSDRRRSSTASPPDDRRKSMFFQRSKRKRRGAVFSTRHPYLQIQRRQRQSLIRSDNCDE